jgi:hypothetical protein
MDSNFPKTFTQAIEDAAYEAIHDWGKYRKLTSIEIQKIRVADVYYKGSTIDAFSAKLSYSYAIPRRKFCYCVVIEDVGKDIELFQEYIHNVIYEMIGMDVDVVVRY